MVKSSLGIGIAAAAFALMASTDAEAQSINCDDPLFSGLPACTANSGGDTIISNSADAAVSATTGSINNDIITLPGSASLGSLNAPASYIPEYGCFVPEATAEQTILWIFGRGEMESTVRMCNAEERSEFEAGRTAAFDGQITIEGIRADATVAAAETNIEVARVEGRYNVMETFVEAARSPAHRSQSSQLLESICEAEGLNCTAPDASEFRPIVRPAAAYTASAQTGTARLTLELNGVTVDETRRCNNTCPIAPNP